MADWIAFRPWWLAQFSGGLTGTPVDMNTDDIRLSLHTSAWTPNFETNDGFDDVTNEVTGGGYTAGGVALPTPTCTRATTTVTFDCGNVTFLQNAGGFTNARRAVIRKYNATAGLSVPMFALDFEADKGNVNGDFVIEMDPLGIFLFTLGA